MKSQTIQIDSIFSADGEIFPFQGINVLAELSAGGQVSLHADTSLVRIILVDEEDIHNLVFEAYPLICDSLDFSFAGHCDETCSLDEVEPYSLIIQVVNAELFLKDLSYSSTPKSNPETLRYEAKRDKDQKKIESLNLNIPTYGMNWTAGDNSIVAYYYEERRHLFGDGYNLLGYDYYAGGVFEFLGHGIYPKVDPDLVRHFDWRERHGANDSLSPYYDGDTLGTGWLTSIKDQGGCGSCWTFAPIGAIEAIINLNTTYHLNFDLSEQQVLSCAYAAGGCSGGNVDSAYYFIKEEGVVTENCCEYLEQSPYCWQLNVCDDPETLVTIKDINGVKYNQDSIRISLIENGPQAVSFIYPHAGNHAVVLTGFKFNIDDSTLTWIFKNSWGTINEPGFEELKISLLTEYEIDPTVYINDVAFKDTCRNEDGDDYYFWGLGPKPENCNCSDTIDCDDNNPRVGGYDENYNCRCIFELDTFSHHITCDTTWADSIYVNYNTIIDSGYCLTISSYAAFAPGARMVVKHGARLLIDGGFLTRACDELWEGIEVWGNDTIQYFDQYFGKITMTNGAVIEFAQIGIANYCKRSASLTMESGGIIMAEDAIFRNNEIDVQFFPFRNTWMGYELPYLGIFTKCTFTTTVDLYQVSDPITHVDMRDVYNVIFDGCVFINELGLSAIPNTNRGKGITSIDANFMLRQYCNTPNVNPCNDISPCEFIGLEYGIKALNSSSLRTFLIHEVNFEDNMVGISLSGIDYASILENDIRCTQYIIGVSKDRFKGGLFLENCTGYHIEGNYIHATGIVLNNESPISGLGVKNSGSDDNEIYRNTFERLGTGIVCIGENQTRDRDTSGLCLKCNEFKYNINDIFVIEDEEHGSGQEQGIHFYQGNLYDTIALTVPAGNTFTYFPNPADSAKVENYNYFNTTEIIYYIHHQRETLPFVTYPLDDNYTEETIYRIEQPILYDSIRSCPSTLDEIGLKNYTDPRTSIYFADENISTLTNQLNLLVDGGNTDELNFEVTTSLPDEGLELSQVLLGDSPYLSDTVIRQAIYKEDVLPNAMIRDIMAANPQSAKKDDLLEALNGRFDPMPDYMMAQIIEGREYFGAKELLEAKILSWQQLRSKAKNELMRQFLLDTNIVHPMDSVIAFLETENDLRSKYDLAFAYWNKNDLINAWQSLNIIPTHFTLNNNQTFIHRQYSEYFDIIQKLADSNWQAFDLDSASVQSLFNIMADGNTEIMAHSRGLLVKGGFMDYWETVIIPPYSKSGPNVFDSKQEVVDLPKSENLRLFPNPCGDYVIAYYNVYSDDLSAFITLHDVKGNMFRKYPLDIEENQIVINLSGLPNGIYLISLRIKDQILDAKKLSKGRY